MAMSADESSVIHPTGRSRDLVLFRARQPPALFTGGQSRPHAFLQQSQDVGAPPFESRAFEPLPALVERTADGFGFRFASQPGDLCGEALHFGVLQIQRHDYTMVYRKWCSGVVISRLPADGGISI
jgi:hypothetical protein